MLICPLLWTVWKTYSGVSVYVQEKRNTTALLKSTFLLWFYCYHTAKSAVIEQLVLNLSSGWYRLLLFFVFFFSSYYAHTVQVGKKRERILMYKDEHRLDIRTSRNNVLIVTLQKCRHPTSISSLSISSRVETHLQSLDCMFGFSGKFVLTEARFPGNNRLIRVIC